MAAFREPVPVRGCFPVAARASDSRAITHFEFFRLCGGFDDYPDSTNGHVGFCTEVIVVCIQCLLDVVGVWADEKARAAAACYPATCQLRIIFQRAERYGRFDFVPRLFRQVPQVEREGWFVFWLF